MSKSQNFNLKIELEPNHGEESEVEIETQQLFSQLRNLDEIESVNRIPEQNIPHGSMLGGAFLLGLLELEVNIENSQKVLQFLGRFLGEKLWNRSVELEVKVNGKHLLVKAANSKELQKAISAAEEFIKNTQSY